MPLFIIILLLIIILLFSFIRAKWTNKTMLEPTIEDSQRLITKLNINPDVVSPEMLKKGMLVEMEHQKGSFDVVNGNQQALAKIALAHIDEYNDYYERLSKMEKEAAQYWQMNGRKNRSVFLN